MPGTSFSTANWSGYDEQSVTNPGSALTDFTLLINVANLSSTWKSEVQSDGADIRLTKGDDTELPYDLIDWTYNAGSPTGWIRVKWSGTLASSGTQNVRVWAGYTGGTATAYDVSETYGSDNAYASHWDGYWPLHDLNDRTSNGYNLTASGATSGATGQVGDCYDFDGSSDYLTNASVPALDEDNEFSILCWFTRDATGTNHVLASQQEGSGGSFEGWRLLIGSDDALSWGVWDSDGDFRRTTSSDTFTSSAFTHVGATYDGSATSAGINLFSGGSLISSTDSDADPFGLSNSSADFEIGSRDNGSLSHNGRIDEVQLHSAELSADWIAEENDQSNDNATFWGTWSWNAAGSSVSIPLVNGGLVNSGLVNAGLVN